MRTSISEIIGFAISVILSGLFPQYILVIIPLVFGSMILYQKSHGCTCFSWNASLPDRRDIPCPYHSQLYAKEEVKNAAKSGRGAITSLLTSKNKYFRSAAREFLKKHPLTKGKDNE